MRTGSLTGPPSSDITLRVVGIQPGAGEHDAVGIRPTVALVLLVALPLPAAALTGRILGGYGDPPSSSGPGSSGPGSSGSMPASIRSGPGCTGFAPRSAGSGPIPSDCCGSPGDRPGHAHPGQDLVLTRRRCRPSRSGHPDPRWLLASRGPTQRVLGPGQTVWANRPVRRARSRVTPMPAAGTSRRHGAHSRRLDPDGGPLGPAACGGSEMWACGVRGPAASATEQAGCTSSKDRHQEDKRDHGEHGVGSRSGFDDG